MESDVTRTIHRRPLMQVGAKSPLASVSFGLSNFPGRTGATHAPAVKKEWGRLDIGLEGAARRRLGSDKFEMRTEWPMASSVAKGAATGVEIGVT